MNVLASKAQLRASFLRWALFLVPLVMLIGFAFSKLGSPNTAWFAGLNKPELFPPFLAFPIIWNILFVMIGCALALVASAWGAMGRGVALIAFAVHFLPTQGWTAVFFGMQDMQTGLMVLGYGVVSLVIALALVWRGCAARRGCCCCPIWRGCALRACSITSSSRPTLMVGQKAQAGRKRGWNCRAHTPYCVFRTATAVRKADRPPAAMHPQGA